MPTSGAPQRLIADLQFTVGQLGAVAPGAVVTAPHGLHQGNLPVKPTSVLPDRSSPVVVTGADEFTITLFNPTAEPQEVVFRVERVHTIHENPVFADDSIPVDPPFTMILWQGLGGDPTGAGSPSYLPSIWQMVAWATPSDQPLQNSAPSGGVPVAVPGSVRGIACDLKLPITAGSLTVTILADAVPIAAIIMTTGSPTFITFPAGMNPFVAGQRITAELAVSADQAPSLSIGVTVLWSPS